MSRKKSKSIIWIRHGDPSSRFSQYIFEMKGKTPFGFWGKFEIFFLWLNRNHSLNRKRSSETMGKCWRISQVTGWRTIWHTVTGSSSWWTERNRTSPVCAWTNPWCVDDTRILSYSCPSCRFASEHIISCSVGFYNTVRSDFTISFGRIYKICSASA